MPLSLPLAAAPLRIACALAVAASLAACQTNTMPINSATATSSIATDSLAQNISDENKTSKDTQPSELTMDMSGRHEYQLENGLKAVIKEDHRAPVAMTQIWYRVGSADEPLDKGGISHLLEHMMFKGTTNVSSDDYERLIAKFGGVNNAFTSYDYTGYYELFPANRMPLALELEADRMTNLAFEKKEVETNKKMSRSSKDFAMLCANCHRMIHRMMKKEKDRVISLSEFKDRINKNFKDQIKKL